MSRPFEHPDGVVVLPSDEDSANALDAFKPEQSHDAPHLLVARSSPTRGARGLVASSTTPQPAHFATRRTQASALGSRPRTVAIGAVIVAAVALVLVAMRFTAPTRVPLGLDAAGVPERPVPPPATMGTAAQAPYPVPLVAASTPAATPNQPPERVVFGQPLVAARSLSVQPPASPPAATAAVRTELAARVAPTDRTTGSVARSLDAGAASAPASSAVLASAASTTVAPPATPPVPVAPPIGASNLPVTSGAAVARVLPVVDRQVYDESHPEVTPPRADGPQLVNLPANDPQVRLEALKVVVVVGPDGRVSSVKGLLAPKNMNEFMLLTAALSNVKTWRYHAAMKGTEPVAYRLVVSLGSTSRFAP